MANSSDSHLVQALTKAYAARAKLFHSGIVASKVDLLIAEIDDIDPTEYSWDLAPLAISESAMSRLRDADGHPHQVFVHPDILMRRPHLVSYYRNLVAVSRKGISQILFGTDAYEARRRTDMDHDQAIRVAQTLNRIISAVIEATPNYSVTTSRKTIYAEIGTELQGTWANMIGKGAASAVENLLADYVEERGIGERRARGLIELAHGWRIVFAAEPDVAFFDNAGLKRIAIEIKGSLDKAGAQTRYGEAKKSFAKQVQENPRCHTIYLASCFTDAVISQIEADGQVRDWFNLTSILYDPDEKDRFLRKLFHIVDTPQ